MVEAECIDIDLLKPVWKLLEYGVKKNDFYVKCITVLHTVTGKFVAYHVHVENVCAPC